MKATAEDEGEEGRERGYTGEEEERHAASSGENPPKRPRHTTGTREEVYRRSR